MTYLSDILWFEDIGNEDLDLVGGKGLNLGKMVSQEFPIPPGFVISSKVYYDFIDATGMKKRIKSLLEEINPENTEKLQETSKKIRQLFLNTEIPERFVDLIKKPFERLKEIKNNLHVAVRSSATAEDLPEASFAGQQDTYLGVDEENYLESVLKCWASLFTARAIYYRENNGFGHLEIGIAVIIQLLIDSYVSGVLFTRHPSTGEDKVVIEAGFGLGEAIVSGSITPDTYLVNPSKWEIENKKISTQAFKIVRKNNDTKEIDLSEKEGSKQKLPDEKIIKLAKLSKKIEDYYDEGQDIEWAFDNKLYIVQSRPITTIRESKKNMTETTTETTENKEIIKGLSASPGTNSGRVKIIKNASELSKIEKTDVLVTTMTTPDMVPAMKRARAIITDEGGMTSHAAIVSRELGIPCVVGTTNATKKLEENMEITVDGKRGIVYKGILQDLLKEEEEKKQSEKLGRSIIITGTKLYVNLSSPDAAQEVAKRNVDGVGLFRAEFIAAQIGIHPQKAIKEGKGEKWSNELAEGINHVASAFNPNPVIYRTLDFKTNEYRELPGGEIEPEENNPMLGYRGCHRNITTEEVFKLELRAIKKVREEYDNKNLHVMLPFVRTTWELKKAIEIMSENDLERNKDFQIWMMVEVPSTVFLIEEFLEYIDGVSIGSNDLTQLVLGVDRDNQNLSELFDERNPAVLKALELVIEVCRDKNKTVSICGQAPSVYEEIVEFLVEKGITSISVNPDTIEKTRKLISRVEKKFMLEKLRKLKT